MPKYKVSFETKIRVEVEIHEDDQDTAADKAWDLAQEYLDTVHGDHRDVTAEATLDGIGAETVKEV